MVRILTIVLTLAIVAGVFTIWPEDAPREDSTVPVFFLSPTDEIRCEGALRLRDAAAKALIGEGIQSWEAVEDQLEQVERDIQTYCY